MTHIQDRSQDWETATDEQHLQGLFTQPPIMNLAWMAYLERKRPHVVTQYLQLWQAQGNYMSPIAKRRLRGKR